jgi:hypothetical protein
VATADGGVVNTDLPEFQTPIDGICELTAELDHLRANRAGAGRGKAMSTVNGPLV